MERFKAQIKYKDWRGTAAADETSPYTMETYLRSRGSIEDNEFLIAITVNVIGEFTNVTAFVFQRPELESVKEAVAAIKGPIPVRRVQFGLALEDFVRLFKSFEVVLTWQGFKLEGREYSVTESLKPRSGQNHSQD
jgi:hypothetical protein